MDRSRIADIAERWMIPTSKTAYMAGLENKPVIAAAEGVRVIDTDGRRYLDFGSGQMAAALPKAPRNCRRLMSIPIRTTS